MELDDKLLDAAEDDDFDKVVEYLNQGADINAQTKYYRKTALHFAVENSNIKLVQYLIEKGADLDIDDMLYFTPLHLAVFNEDLGMLELLLSKGACLNSISKEDGTPLITAVGREWIEGIKLMSTYCLIIDDPDYDPDCGSPLHVAIDQEQWEIVDFLLSLDNQTLDINIMDDERRTILIKLIHNQKIELIKRVLAYPRINLNDEEYPPLHQACR